MCGCEKHNDERKPCTCICPEHGNFQAAYDLAMARYDEIVRLRALLAATDPAPDEALLSVATLIEKYDERAANESTRYVRAKEVAADLHEVRRALVALAPPNETATERPGFDRFCAQCRRWTDHEAPHHPFSAPVDAEACVMTCSHRLAEGPLVCTRSDDHVPGHGCTYESTTVADGRHDDEGNDW